MIYKCEKCNGFGTIEVGIMDVVMKTIEGKEIETTSLKRRTSCTFCNGTGKLNWVENIFGKKQKSY